MNKRAVTRKLESFNNKCCWFHETQDKDQRRQCAKRASPHALRRDRRRREWTVVVVSLLLVPQYLLHPCWCALPVPGHSEGNKTLQDTNASNPSMKFSAEST